MGASVVLSEYDPRWPRLFEQERAAILKALGPRVVGIEHIGSTAVPGLGAKPILDIMVAVRDLKRDFPAILKPLHRIGYEYVPRPDFFESRFCCQGQWGPSTRHLHVTELGSAFWNEKLLFRDYLRHHPESAAEYYRLKRALAARYAENRSAYTDAKASFIYSVLERARSTSPMPNLDTRPLDRQAVK